MGLHKHVQACAPHYVTIRSDPHKEDYNYDPVGNCFLADPTLTSFSEYSPCRDLSKSRSRFKVTFETCAIGLVHLLAVYCRNARSHPFNKKLSSRIHSCHFVSEWPGLNNSYRRLSLIATHLFKYKYEFCVLQLILYYCYRTNSVCLLELSTPFTVKVSI